MTTTLLPTTTTTSTGTTSTGTTSTGTHLVRTGAAAAIASAAAATATAAIAHSAGVRYVVGGDTIPLAGFAQLTAVFAAVGAIIAAVVSRRAARPRRTFVATTVTLTALSFVPDVLADAHTATKLTLMLTHVVAAAVAIPLLAARLSD